MQGNNTDDQPGRSIDDHDQKDEVEHIERLRQALLNEKDLKSRLDDKFLLKFLRARKFDHHRALALVKNYYYQRIKYPDLYKNFRYSSYPDVFEIRGIGQFSDPQGRSVIFIRDTPGWDPSKVPLSNLLAGTLITLELLSDDEDAQRNGFVVLFDVEGFGFRHLRAFNLFIIAQMISVTFNSFPFRYKRVHFINPPVYFKILFSIIKPFLTKKLKKRIQLHGSDLSSLYEELPREFLPEEFGGHLGPFDHTKWQARLRDNDAVLERDSVFGYTSE